MTAIIIIMTLSVKPIAVNIESKENTISSTTIWPIRAKKMFFPQHWYCAPFLLLYNVFQWCFWLIKTSPQTIPMRHFKVNLVQYPTTNQFWKLMPSINLCCAFWLVHALVASRILLRWILSTPNIIYKKVNVSKAIQVSGCR